MTTTSPAAAMGFGTSVATAGDVNGDGFADVVVGATGTSAYAGGAYVYLGGASGLASSPANTLANTDPACPQFTASVVIAGDVNGDGFADVAVGESGGFMSTNVGHTYVYLGGATGVSSTPISLVGPGTAAGNFGLSVATAAGADLLWQHSLGRTGLERVRANAAPITFTR